MKFSEIPGLDDAKERLKTMVLTGHTPHALLIEGPTGSGKMALARAMAQLIHCSAPTADGEPCGVCPACHQHQGFNNIDTFYVFPIVKAEGASSAPVSDDYIDKWRKYLAESTYVSPSVWGSQFSKKNAIPTYYVTQATTLIRRLALAANGKGPKIVIFWQPEAMPAAVANKMLKLIEEPLDDTMFIFVSERPNDILPTIYSRLQRVSIRRLSDDVVSRLLRSAHPELSADAADAIAHIAEGNAIAAFNIADHNDARSDNLQRFISLMRLAYQRKVPELRDWSNKLAELGREREIDFYRYAIRMMRENFVYRLSVPQLTYLTVDEEQFSSRFARFITEVNVERLIGHFQKAIEHISANVNGKMVNFDVAIKVILLIKTAVQPHA